MWLGAFATQSVGCMRLEIKKITANMTQLQQVIEDIASAGRILSIQPGGNYGDYLIYRGFDKMLEKSTVEKIPFADGNERYDRPPDLPSGNIKDYLKWLSAHSNYLRNRLYHNVSAVYIQGGGNFNDLWMGGVNCYKAAARYFSCPIIVGPQSCLFKSVDPKKVFEGVDNETHFFCREEYSYDIIEQATTDLEHVTPYLSQDTALYLDTSDLSFDRLSEEYSLVAMRSDKESAEPLIEYDIEGPLLVQDISITAGHFTDWVNLVAKAKVVYTDRLHVAILATILDKPLYWYEATYHKSRGVYEYSLAEKDTIYFHYLW